MTIPDLPPPGEDVSQDVRAEISRVMRGLMHRGSPLARPEPAARCTPVTSEQWWMAYADSCLERACSQLDDAAADLLDIRHVPVPLVRRRLPKLVVGLATAYGRVKDIQRDLGRFSPPESQAGPAELVCEVAQASYAFATAILQCAADGLSAASRASAMDARRQSDRVLDSITPPAGDDPHGTQPGQDPLLETTLGLPTTALSAGDGLTFASRVAAIWAEHPELDDRLRTLLPHLLDPVTPLRDRVRMHLTSLLRSPRPLVAHQAAVATRDLVLRALSADPANTVRAIADGTSLEPVMYATHQCLIDAVRALNQASSPQHEMRPAVQMYNPVMEGGVRRVARLVLQLLGRHVTDTTTLTPLAEQLAAMSGEPMCVLLSSCINTRWRNAIAHEQVWWDSTRQQVMLAGEPVDPADIAHEALRAHEICRGFDTGLAVALNQSGNPQDGKEPCDTETASSIRLLLTMGKAGITAVRLDRHGTTIQPLIAPLTFPAMDRLHRAILENAAREPEPMDWDIRQTANRSSYRISQEAIAAVLRAGEPGSAGGVSIELPTAALPMILSGLAAHEPGSAATVPAMISLAATQISGEHRRLAPRLAAGSRDAHAALLQTMRHAARAIDAAATLLQGDRRQELKAFSQLVGKTHEEIASDISDTAGLRVIELALRSSGRPRLPWLEDIPG